MITALIAIIIALLLVIAGEAIALALYSIRSRKADAIIDQLETENVILRSVEADLRKGLRDRA